MHRSVIFLLLVLAGCTSKQEKKNLANSDSIITTKEQAVNPDKIAGVSVDSAVLIIRKTFQGINKLPLKTRKFTYTVANCVDEGEVTYMLDSAGEIRKVVGTGFIGDGSWTNSYYYQNGQFVFSLETLIGGPAIGAATTTRLRKYVYDNRVVRMQEDEKITTLKDSVLTPAAKEYKILDAYKTRDFERAFCN